MVKIDIISILLTSLKPAMVVVMWLLPIFLIAAFLRSARVKGIIGENLVRLSAKVMLPENIYHPFHNVTLLSEGGTTQIDHIFVSSFGVFVVETKNMKGWIYGEKKQPTWTQKIYRRSYKFQNPLHQNYKHIKTLEALLDIPSEAIRSVVVFIGSCQFKTDMPENVQHGMSYISFIKSFDKRLLTEAQVDEAIAQIKSTQLESCRATTKAHIQQLKLSGESKLARTCPECGHSMVLRTAKKGKNRGGKFWGCSHFPACRTVQEYLQ